MGKVATPIIAGLLLVAMVLLLYKLYRESGPWKREDWGMVAFILLCSVAVAILAHFVGAP